MTSWVRSCAKRIGIFAGFGPVVGLFWLAGVDGGFSAIMKVAVAAPIAVPIAYVPGLVPAIATGVLDELLPWRLPTAWRVPATTLVGTAISAGFGATFAEPGTALMFAKAGTGAALVCAALSPTWRPLTPPPG